MRHKCVVGLNVPRHFLPHNTVPYLFYRIERPSSENLKAHIVNSLILIPSEKDRKVLGSPVQGSRPLSGSSFFRHTYYITQVDFHASVPIDRSW